MIARQEPDVLSLYGHIISSHRSAAAAWSQLTSPKAASPGLAQRAACIDLEWSSVENCLSRNDFLNHRNICLAFKCHDTSNQGNNMAVQQAPKLRDSVIQYKLTQNDMVVSHSDCTFFLTSQQVYLKTLFISPLFWNFKR